MKILHALGLTALLVQPLSACSAAATESASSPDPSVTAFDSPTAAPSPTVLGSPELREALEATMYGSANRDALADMEALHAIALKEVRPAVSAEDWGMADIVRINASLDSLQSELTDEELGLESIEYATLVGGIANNAGVFSW